MIKPKALKSLSICFPCYNEELNVGTMIEQAVQVGESYGVDYEVIVVDDGSRDRSAEVVQAWSGKNPRVKLVQHKHNLGYGAAVRTSLENTTKELVFLTDGDNQFHLSEIDKLFFKIDSCDVVTGYRLGRQDKPHRRLNGFLWTQLNRMLFGLPVRDVDCAFKLFRRKTLEKLKIRSNYLLVHSEILSRIQKRGFKIEEVGVTHYPRMAGKATATAIKSVLKTFQELLALYWDIKTDKMADG